MNKLTEVEILQNEVDGFEPDDMRLPAFVSFRRLPLEVNRSTCSRLDRVLELGATAARTTSFKFPERVNTLNLWFLWLVVNQLWIRQVLVLRL